MKIIPPFQKRLAALKRFFATEPFETSDALVDSIHSFTQMIEELPDTTDVGRVIAAIDAFDAAINTLQQATVLGNAVVDVDAKLESAPASRKRKNLYLTPANLKRSDLPAEQKVDYMAGSPP